MKGEFQLIERLKALIPRSLQGKIPIGDDAALLHFGSRPLLFTTDVIVENVDFKTGKGGARPEAVGRKALAVNLSDLAAMGGCPLAFVAAMGIPKSFPPSWAERAAKGMIRLARKYRTAWVGGDLSRASRAFISIALLGKPAGLPVRRSGARPGERIYVTGTLGGSIEGRHLQFEPRLREARFLAHRFRPSAMIDLSDGLIQDLGHLLTASRVGARVDLARVPVSKAALKRARGRTRPALRSALADGEDFELLFTLPPGRGARLEKAWKRAFPRTPLSKIGTVVRGSGKIFWKEGEQSKKLWFQKKGFTHF